MIVEEATLAPVNPEVLPATVTPPVRSEQAIVRIRGH